MPATRAAAALAAPAAPAAGLLIVNADDWGRDRHTTDMIFDCIRRGAVQSTSAMVFMEDSERAATIAREQTVDAGLHLNFTTPFSAASVPAALAEHQRTLIRYLRSYRLAQVVFHPGLRRSFEYVVAAQLDEFRRLFGAEPHAIDGHHHMHLSANVLFQGLLPAGALVRRNFSFQAGEKGILNRTYRSLMDGMLGRRHRTVDFLFSLAPIEPERLQRIFTLAERFVVELETHPVESDEYRYLAGGEIFHHIGNVQMGPHTLVSPNGLAERGHA